MLDKNQLSRTEINIRLIRQKFHIRFVCSEECVQIVVETFQNSVFVLVGFLSVVYIYSERQTLHFL